MFNLANVYGHQNKVNEAKKYWRKGLACLEESDKDTTLGILLGHIYGFAKLDESWSIDFDGLRSFILKTHPPIRMTNAILQDLLIIQSIENLRQPQHINEAINFIEDYLPTVYISVSYLWRQIPNKAVDIWIRKLPELYLEHNLEHKNSFYEWFGNHLWLLIYCGLIKIFDKNRHASISKHFEKLKSDPRMGEKLQKSICGFNEFSEKSKSFQKLNPEEFDEWSIEKIVKYITEDIDRVADLSSCKDLNEEVLREILNDVKRKHDIFLRGIRGFEESDFKTGISNIFQPVKDFYISFENRIKRERDRET